VHYLEVNEYFDFIKIIFRIDFGDNEFAIVLISLLSNLIVIFWNEVDHFMILKIELQNYLNELFF
jgi:hypothetical protein